MNRHILLCLCWIIVASTPVLAQETLYPVRDNTDAPMILTEDHFAVVAEKSFEYKLTFGFPANDKAWFFPNTRTRIVVLWLRIQNLSQRPIQFETSKFTSTDDAGKTSSVLTADEASRRIIAGADGTPITKTLHGISLGHAGNKPTEDQLKEDILRYSLQSGQIAGGGVVEGLIYFERPEPKKFNVKIRLGDLWSKPFIFSNVKPK